MSYEGFNVSIFIQIFSLLNNQIVINCAQNVESVVMPINCPIISSFIKTHQCVSENIAIFSTRLLQRFITKSGKFYTTVDGLGASEVVIIFPANRFCLSSLSILNFVSTNNIERIYGQ